MTTCVGICNEKSLIYVSSNDEAIRLYDSA